jgi:hypothetical protein
VEGDRLRRRKINAEIAEIAEITFLGDLCDLRV